MHIAQLLLDIQLPGCRSLKEKRGRLRHLKDKFGADANTAVSENDLHDRHDCAQWCFVVIGADKAIVLAQLQRIEDHVHQYVDGYVSHCERQLLG
ncbi:MAG: DUF503 domain-containing protein [Porticoccaceae bacterium]